MNTENPVPRRSGPHAPLPSVAAAVGDALATGSAPPAADRLAASPSSEGVGSATAVSTREEDPRVRAARRTQELEEHGSLDQGSDKFYIDPKIIPDGWSYEYRRFTVLGHEDPSYQVELANAGWEPVPLSRHPELMPAGHQGNTILRLGQMLMERPKVITDKKKAADYRAARDQVRAKETQLGAAPPGTFERDNKGVPLASVKKNFESIPIPEK